MKRLTLIIVIAVLLLPCLSGYEKISKRDAKIGWASAKRDFKYGQFDENLVTNLQTVLKYNPEFLQALKNLGDIYYQWSKDNFDEKLSYLEKAYKMYDLALAVVALKPEDKKQAKTYLKIMQINASEFEVIASDAKTKQRNCWILYFKEGQTLFKSATADSPEGYDKSIAIFQKLHQIAPDSLKT
ncbi:MAG: hypothetical protein K8S56_07990, partial [Candidatus Cloacimonetes bacterium]|nr:hypothetical protein [Candidatus Cloacimonadota bacterium]